MGNKHPDTRKERTWYELCDIDVQIRVMVVEAPITFGHSQLILETNKNVEEAARFEMATIAIKKCLPIIKECIPAAIENEVWKKLREYTHTHGTYIKTLILRASAKEDDQQYKMHLVPYFASHRESTCQLFHEDRDIQNDDVGGLLGWLGRRERALDDEIELLRDTERFPTALINSFELIRLADALKDTAAQLAR